MAKKYKVMVIIAAAVLILGIAAFAGYKYYSDAENKIARVAKNKVEDASSKDETFEFIGHSKVEYNKDEDYYVVSGFMEVNDEYEAGRRVMYIAIVEENMGEYQATEVERTDDEVKYEFVDYFSDYEEEDDEEDDY
ncbi:MULTISPECIES: hypothetical protein [unclassified Bacillus (in: firmicutes)]|uniref:hypothetical protein n=1 Tax=unclassified Bacillus (in: firmicutes) TaxID=185979 RepID=UPI00080ACA94|nr:MULTISPECIES: hypothetical protein [unclassified Bacillus (in: firmicutes)]OCA86844.1 hypothetical protein A8L44_06090 [Bacillus sp. FJAT-27986]